ncbi:hypothetical protein OIU78_009479 [Salix suchowensis]|nr:hypothetical protein OIU78_009479 [Salix suchowensis]
MEGELAMLRQFIGQVQDLLNLHGSPLPPFDSLQLFHSHNQQQQNHNNGNNNNRFFLSDFMCCEFGKLK